MLSNDSIRVEFELAKEGNDKLTYREIYPRGVVGTFYLSRIAALFKWDKVPQRIAFDLRSLDDEQ